MTAPHRLLSQIPPCFLLPTHLDQPVIDHFLERLLSAGAPLVNDVVEAKVFLGRVGAAKRAALELRCRGLWTEQIEDAKGESLTQPYKGPILSHGQKSTDATALSMLESVPTGHVVVVKVDWLLDSIEAQEVLSLAPYKVYQGCLVSRPPSHQVPRDRPVECPGSPTRQVGENAADFVERRLPSRIRHLDGPLARVVSPANTLGSGHTDASTFHAGAAQEIGAFRRRKAETGRAPQMGRLHLRDSLLRLGRECNVRGGKWLLFVDSEERVDGLWKRIVQSTLAGQLGNLSEVQYTPPSQWILSMYTIDCEDMEDVKRVLTEIQRICGPVIASMIYYKPEVYSLLALQSGNDLGLKTSLYNSFDIWKPQGQ